MSDVLSIIGDIESGIESRLRDKGLRVGSFSITQEPETIVCPAANIAFVDGQCSRVAQKTYRMDAAKFQATVIVADVRGEDSRRKAAYRLVMGVLSMLSGKIMKTSAGADVSMRPFVPGRVQKVYESESRIAYSIDFTTSFTFEEMDDETAAEMLTVMLSYHVKPGDDIADAADEVELDAA